jgi:hypothetical protein
MDKYLKAFDKWWKENMSRFRKGDTRKDIAREAFDAGILWEMQKGDNITTMREIFKTSEKIARLEGKEQGEAAVLERIEAVMRRYEAGFDYCQNSNDFWFDYPFGDYVIREATFKEALEKAEEGE